MIKKPIATLLATTLLTSFGAISTEVEVNNILGATHMNSLYQFTNKPVLEEGADVLANMGMAGIKLWFGPDYRTNYAQNHDWPDVYNLTELAQTEYFNTMFSDPRFVSYSLELATFDKHTAWKDGLDDEERQVIYDEIYSFTKYLLETYNNSGKTFILQNWEGDNNLGQGQDPEGKKVEGMIAWLNARQDAITDAVADTNHSNVNVYGAAECNKVGQPDWDGARMLTDVFPYLHMDLYSYSDWYTRESTEQLIIDLNRIKQYAPDSAAFGSDNVMLGEFGNKRLVNGGSSGDLDEDANYEVSKIELETALDIGARYAFYWATYDSNTVKSHGLVLNQFTQQTFVPEAGVDESGRYYSKTYDYFRNDATRLTMSEDNATDFSQLSSWSDNLALTSKIKTRWDNEVGLYTRADTQPSTLSYSFDKDIVKFAIPTYEDARKKNVVKVELSSSGNEGSYIEIPLTTIDAGAHELNWHRILYRNAQPLDAGYRYAKVTFDSTEAWSPKVSATRFYHHVVPESKVVVFGSNQALISDNSFKTHINADEIVQWNGIDSWGNDEHIYGSLNQALSGASIKASASDITLTLSDVSSQSELKTVVSGGVLGVHGGDNAKFDATLSESISIHFDKDTTITKLVLGGFTYNLEQITLSVDGVTTSILKADASVAAASWDDRLSVITLVNPIAVNKGSIVEIATNNGQWGLSAIVATVQP